MQRLLNVGSLTEELTDELLRLGPLESWPSDEIPWVRCLFGGSDHAMFSVVMGTNRDGLTILANISPNVEGGVGVTCAGHFDSQSPCIGLYVPFFLNEPILGGSRMREVPGVGDIRTRVTCPRST